MNCILNKFSESDTIFLQFITLRGRPYRSPLDPPLSMVATIDSFSSITLGNIVDR